jgi:hypothetical protein
MIKRMAKCLLQLLCKHEWVQRLFYKDYYDYSGYHVKIYDCYCQKCGKRKMRKYYDGQVR